MDLPLLLILPSRFSPRSFRQKEKNLSHHFAPKEPSKAKLANLGDEEKDRREDEEPSYPQLQSSVALFVLPPLLFFLSPSPIQALEWDFYYARVGFKVKQGGAVARGLLKN